MSTSTLKATRRAATTTAARRVGIYTRISKDKSDGKGAGLGVARQREDCEAYVARNGLGVVYEPPDGPYDDNDRSGWDPDTVRPGFDRLLADVRAGRLSAVVAWHCDRFTRQPEQLEALWKACKRTGTDFHTVLGGHATSALALRILGAVSAEESDVKSARVERKHMELAKAGKYHGGPRRFGYEPGMKAVRESEAWYVRQLAERVLAGESLRSLANWLIAEGVAAPQGGVWNGGNVGQMLQRPHLVGIRIHHGVAYEAEWDPILDRPTWELVQHVLGDPKRRTTTTSARKYLLAGLGTCAACGQDLRGRPCYDRDGRKVAWRAYACASGRHCHRRVEWVDQVVTDRIVERLTLLTEEGELAPDDPDATRVADLQQDLEDLKERRAAVIRQQALGRLDEEGFGLSMETIQGERERLQLELDTLRNATRKPQAALSGMTGPGAAAAWEAATLGRQRAIIETLATVKLHGAVTRRAPFRAEDVEITFREDL